MLEVMFFLSSHEFIEERFLANNERSISEFLLIIFKIKSFAILLVAPRMAIFITLFLMIGS